MAAVSFIGGSVLGWIAAATALMAGTLASTALIIFLLTSLTCAALTLYIASTRLRPTSEI
ncbi:MAG: hypothetical protein ACSHXH_01415 [Marivita sp.]|uniref:hypothetical protein n=1 Tax=Marivita sp. TaxID=2003365 RepID=UPI003EF94BBB